MTLALQPKEKISLRLFRWVMLTALVAGGFLSLTQIALDADRARKVIDDDAVQLLAVVTEPATQAVYSIDPELAEQVIEGLFKKRAVRFASIGHPDESLLAQRSRPLLDSPTRWLTDPIFRQERQYSIRLIKDFPSPTYYGDLTITIDTAYEANSFLERSWVVFVSGLVRAAILGGILFLICHVLLTRPLMTLIRELSSVNPAEPGETKLNLPSRHVNDEFGTWIDSANTLLDEIAHNQKKRRAAEARVLKLSQYDPLTGLPNRLMLHNHLKNALKDAEKLNQKVAVLCCGIDDFKSINDQFSYATGDILLQMYCERLTKDVGTPIVAARLGGDQFALIAYNINTTFRTIRLVEELLKELNKPFEVGNHVIQLRTTIGITLYPDDGEDPDKLLQKSEQTMTLAKSLKRNQYQFYVASVDSEMRERRQLAKELLGALENGDLFLVYQPQIDYTMNRVIGAEALIRWVHPDKGFIPPDVFIPIAENEGSIVPIGQWVIEQVCQQVKAWLQIGLDLKVAINVSTVQLQEKNIEKAILDTLNRFGIPPRHLEIEVTETSFMQNIREATTRLENIKKLGISTAVDDFGTGYSSLSYLKQLPIDKIKIDKQFVQDLLTNEEDTSIVDAIILMGKSLKLKVVAEGVETKQQQDYLIARHCEMAQGYYYAKPLPPEEFVDFVQEFNGTESVKDHNSA